MGTGESLCTACAGILSVTGQDKKIPLHYVRRNFEGGLSLIPVMGRKNVKKREVKGYDL